MGARGFPLCVVPPRRRIFGGRDGAFHPLRTCPDYCKRFAVVPAELGITGVRWLRDETEYQEENRAGTELSFHWFVSQLLFVFCVDRGWVKAANLFPRKTSASVSPHPD